MFGKLLIANRGEIACRVIRTARRMGIRTVAVFSEADAKALHVEMADEAVAIGPAPARESYLRINRIIDAAKATGAEAIHPGYGFLSENPLFAEACAEAGIVFVGPTAAAMRAMGSKADAKRLMQEAGVPLVPGYHGEDQSDLLLTSEAAKIGYPVLIKASAGGGGRGMRAVERAEDFASALSAARREAEAAFGDGRVLIEKYLQRPRHIEVQVLADTHGTTLHLGTRDCSIQRRHQKIVEEAPAPGLSDATREAMHQAAISAARACGYVNAGTIEFIAEGTGPDPDFYFMEMNTRLQVEHPVTEEIFGIDLVEQQLLVAAGERLGLAQDKLRARGHAIEVRLCAEDPAHDYRPTAGHMTLWFPDRLVGIRYDTGYRSNHGGGRGDVLPASYDNLIAKIISTSKADDARTSRRLACRQLGRALNAIGAEGLVTNLELLRSIAEHEAFRSGNFDTGFLRSYSADLLPKRTPQQLPPEALAAAALAWLLDEGQVGATLAGGPANMRSPWDRRDGFRLSGQGHIALRARCSEAHYNLILLVSPVGKGLAIDGAPAVAIDGERYASGGWEYRPENLLMTFAGRKQAVEVRRNERLFAVRLPAKIRDVQTHNEFQIYILDPYAPPDATVTAADRITAPIPGTILRVDVAVGHVVARGQVLVVMEAMKTELRLAAPADGIVARVLVQPGDMVQEGMELVQLTHDEAKPKA